MCAAASCTGTRCHSDSFRLDCGDRNLGFPRDGCPAEARLAATVNLKPIRDFTSDYNPVAGRGDAIADQKRYVGV